MIPSYTKTLNEEEYISSLKNVIDELEKITESSMTIYSIKNQSLVTERLATALRHVAQSGTRLEKLIKGQVLDSAFKAEKAGPNSTKIFLKFVVSAMRILVSDLQAGSSIKEITKKLDDFSEVFSSEIEKSKKEATIEDVAECVRNASKSKRISKMVLEAVELAGLEGNILPTGSPNGKYSVELVSGYNFPVSTYPLFTEEDNGRWGRGNVRILAVDGVIERASEVHKILNEAHANKAPHLFVARGYGEEVVATIATNKSLDICPIRIPWELESINILADIATVSGTDVVSTLKGESVSSVEYDSLKIVEKVICSKENLNILNSSTKLSVANHISQLYKKREETSLEEMSEFLDKRIKSLNSHTVHIRLGSKTEQEKMKELEAADFALRVVKGVISKGTVKVNELGVNEIMPTTSVMSAFFHGSSLMKSLISVKCAIMEDA